ncbi:MAG: ABC transporter permease [Bacillota bacterium]
MNRFFARLFRNPFKMGSNDTNNDEAVLTPGKIIWKRFRRNKVAMVGSFILLVLIILAILAPLLTPYERDAIDLLNQEEPPTSEHIFGSDRQGRDLFTRNLYGGRISLTVGLVASSLQMVIGVLMGSLAGYYGKWMDTVIMRITDMVISFPFLALAITAAAILGPSIYNTMLIIGLLTWTETCRLVRGQFLSIKQMEYIEAAKANGASEFRLIWRHMLPNALAPILISATLIMATAILIEAALSYLGLGVQPPIPSWGNILEPARNMTVLMNMWWLWLPPGFLIFISVLSINLVGDGLRDALDPRLKN